MTWFRRLLVNVAVAAGALLVFFAFVELQLRIFPRWLLPKGAFGAGAYSEEVGLSLHGGRMIYNKVRFVEREPNADGFMDVEHEREHPAGTLRVGFFGDSYVEAVQVPLEQVFFRLLPAAIEGTPIEAFGFGKSGWGAVHELMVWRTMGARYGLDVVGYVFVENDPGDSSYRLAAERRRGFSPIPYAEPSEAPPGFALRWVGTRDDLPPLLRAAKWVQGRSLLAQVVFSRLALLRQRGVQVRADARAVDMTQRAGAVPDSNDAPSTWPPALRAEVQLLNERILAAWRDEVRAQGGHFFVLYVPRGDRQLRGELAPDDTWLPWLEETTERLGVPLLDPSPAFAALLARGEAVYDDHFTPAGHEVIAGEIERYLAALLRGRAEEGASASTASH